MTTVRDYRPETIAEFERIFSDVKDYINENYMYDDITIDSFSLVMGYSIRSTQRALQYKGNEWRKMLARKRISVAAESLLNDDTTIEKIAASVGYTSPAQFGKAFRRYYDMTPREYRQVFRGNGNRHG